METMETGTFIETLRRDGELLADAAERAGLDVTVPACPQWHVRDLVGHVGSVHRWATEYVAQGRTEPVPLAGEVPQDATLLDWFREGHDRLVKALGAAPADLQCWSFLAAPSPLAFWARRQAHETAIHRVDAEAALGGGLSPMDSAFAADGVDELLAGFHTRERSRVRSDRPRTLLVQAADVPAGTGEWLVRISPQVPVVERGAAGGAAAADCVVRGSATDLYLALWNRGPFEGIEVSGDASLVDLWRETSGI